MSTHFFCRDVAVRPPHGAAPCSRPVERFEPLLDFVRRRVDRPLHLSGNVGIFGELCILDRPAYDQLPTRCRYTFGRGDLHLPPFRGNIPFGELFRRLGGCRARVNRPAPARKKRFFDFTGFSW